MSMSRVFWNFFLSPLSPNIFFSFLLLRTFVTTTKKWAWWGIPKLIDRWSAWFATVELSPFDLCNWFGRSLISKLHLWNGTLNLWIDDLPLVTGSVTPRNRSVTILQIIAQTCLSLMDCEYFLGGLNCGFVGGSAKCMLQL